MGNHILVIFWGVCLVAQLVLVIAFNVLNEHRIAVLEYAGYAVWIVSMIFGWLPILIFKKKGGVARGKSYVHTTTLVTTGLYGIIRHPQYTAGILLSLALLLVSQHVIIILLGVVVMPLLYIDIMKADRSAIGKFGDEYRRYMKKVPRTNFILGIIRYFRKP